MQYRSTTSWSACAVAVCVLLFEGGSPLYAQCSPLELDRLTASDAAEVDEFGVSVGISGDTIVVGSYLGDTTKIDAGAAYVYLHSGASWPEQAKLFAPDPGINDQFGTAVAISGDTVIVGSPFNNNGAGDDSGAAYVFVRGGTVWSFQAKLIPDDSATNENFGVSVAISGNTALIGSYRDNTPAGSNTGSAFVFVRSGTAWSQQAKLIASDAAPSDAFGISVALSGDTAVVGADLDDDGGNATGSAYVFVRSGTVWTQQGKLLANDAQPNDNLGISVGVEGDTAVVGAWHDDTPGGGNAGSAYVFVRSGTVWTQQGHLFASDGAPDDNFGVSVAVDGDIAVVGSYLNATPAGDTGAAYYYKRSGTTWSQQPKLIGVEAAPGGSVGYSVAVEGETAVVGALDDPPDLDSGAAYVFALGCTAVVCCPGDFNGNQAVGPNDIPAFISALLSGSACPALPACCPADLNGDLIVNGKDVEPFVTKLLNGGACP